MRTREEINAYHREWSRRNRSKCSEYHARWKAKHPEISASAQSAFKARHPEYQAEWYEANKEMRRAQLESYRKKNKWRWAAQRAERRALETMSCPPWSDREAIARIYAKAQRMSVTTGVAHEVDHIWPLKGHGFTGLHIHWNLRVVVKEVNRKKHNKSPLIVDGQL